MTFWCRLGIWRVTAEFLLGQGDLCKRGWNDKSEPHVEFSRPIGTPFAKIPYWLVSLIILRGNWGNYRIYPPVYLAQRYFRSINWACRLSSTSLADSTDTCASPISTNCPLVVLFRSDMLNFLVDGEKTSVFVILVMGILNCALSYVDGFVRANGKHDLLERGTTSSRVSLNSHILHLCFRFECFNCSEDLGSVRDVY